MLVLQVRNVLLLLYLCFQFTLRLIFLRILIFENIHSILFFKI